MKYPQFDTDENVFSHLNTYLTCKNEEKHLNTEIISHSVSKNVSLSKPQRTQFATYLQIET